MLLLMHHPELINIANILQTQFLNLLMMPYFPIDNDNKSNNDNDNNSNNDNENFLFSIVLMVIHVESWTTIQMNMVMLRDSI